MGSRAGCVGRLSKADVVRNEKGRDELQDQTSRTKMGAHRGKAEPSLGLRVHRARVRYARRRFADRSGELVSKRLREGRKIISFFSFQK